VTVHSQHLACGRCGRSFEPLTPHSFSFNSYLGWCPACEGLGVQRGANPSALLEDPKRTLAEGAQVTVSCAEGDTGNVYAGRLEVEIVKLSGFGAVRAASDAGAVTSSVELEQAPSTTPASVFVQTVGRFDTRPSVSASLHFKTVPPAPR